MFLWRCRRGWPSAPPPPELQARLDAVGSGQPSLRPGLPPRPTTGRCGHRAATAAGWSHVRGTGAADARPAGRCPDEPELAGTRRRCPQRRAPDLGHVRSLTVGLSRAWRVWIACSLCRVAHTVGCWRLRPNSHSGRPVWMGPARTANCCSLRAATRGRFHGARSFLAASAATAPACGVHGRAGGSRRAR